MSSREPKTRDRILEATWRLMVERVGRNVRMGDVARGAGVSRQAAYDHFGSRAELMVATVRYGDGVLALNQRLRPHPAAGGGGGVSGQAVYGRFGSRAELMVATVRYGDGVLALNQRLRRYRAASSGDERLEAYVEFWGHDLPEIY